MTAIVDDTGRVREVKRVIDNNQSGDGPKQMVNLRVDGGNLAIALALVALGGLLVGSIMLPQMMRAQSEAAAANAVRAVAVQATQASERSYNAQTDSKLTSEYLKVLQIELAKRGIFVQLDGHH